MKYFLQIAAYLFHPLIMPFWGAVIYYSITPRFIEPDLIRTKLFEIAIITFLIPIITFFLLKNLTVINSINLTNVDERKFPLMVQILLLFLILKMVYSPYDSPEMYYFFVGILFSSLAALVLVFFKFKISLHQMGIAGVTMFIIGLSIHFKINLLLGIGIFFFCNGWIASSRLDTKSHIYPELIAGLFLGIIPQIIMLNFWL